MTFILIMTSYECICQMTVGGKKGKKKQHPIQGCLLPACRPRQPRPIRLDEDKLLAKEGKSRQGRHGGRGGPSSHTALPNPWGVKRGREGSKQVMTRPVMTRPGGCPGHPARSRVAWGCPGTGPRPKPTWGLQLRRPPKRLDGAGGANSRVDAPHAAPRPARPCPPCPRRRRRGGRARAGCYATAGDVRP